MVRAYWCKHAPRALFYVRGSYFIIVVVAGGGGGGSSSSSSSSSSSIATCCLNEWLRAIRPYDSQP